MSDLQRVVITGMGIVSPNGIGLEQFNSAIKSGVSGVRFVPELEINKFRCQLAGVPPLNDLDKSNFKSKYQLSNLKSSGILYGLMAVEEAWIDAGLAGVYSASKSLETGCIFGTGSNGVEASNYGINILNTLGSQGSDGTNVLQVLNSGVSAYIAAVFRLGNMISSNASACNTGTEALLNGALRIKMGLADRMVVGSSESDSPYVWAPFDAMFATAQGFNSIPEKASCPMSKFAAGFVPSSGAGAFVIENLHTAKLRGAKIYAELLGGAINSGGQRGDGTMTLGNLNGMIKCIEDSLKIAGVKPADLDLLCGHLSSTVGDVREIQSWTAALNLSKTKFPFINSMKSMIGHCLSASGSIETIATVLQLRNRYIHPSLNAEQLHPEIESLILSSVIPKSTIYKDLRIAAKVSLGFGDVNSCIILKRWDGN